MGTRSTTKIYEKFGDKKRLLLALYKQYDGYIDGWGLELSKFLKSKPFVNGISDNDKVFNGLGCFALQLVCDFKKGAGELYATNPDDEQEYNYIIVAEYKEETCTITLTCDEDEDYKTTIRYKTGL